MFFGKIGGDIVSKSPFFWVKWTWVFGVGVFGVPLNSDVKNIQYLCALRKRQ